MRVERGDSFQHSLEQSLDHPHAPSLLQFDQELLQIVAEIGEVWDRLIPSKDDPYRRVLIRQGYLVPLYSVQAHLRPDGVIELESFAVDWDWPPSDPDANTDE